MILFFCFSNMLQVILSRKLCLFTQWISAYNSVCAHCQRTLLIDDLFNDKNIMEHNRYFKREDNFNMEDHFNSKRRFPNVYSQSHRERTWIC